MKRFFIVLLSCLMAFSLFACTDQENPEQGIVISAYNTVIRDSNGEDKCFWPDGRAIWAHKNHHFDAIQSATLSLQTEYDMSFSNGDSNKEIEVSNSEFYFPTEFEYDKSKIDIKESDKPNHFILTVLQPCDKEEIIITFNWKSSILDENGELGVESVPVFFTITVSTEIKNNETQFLLFGEVLI